MFKIETLQEKHFPAWNKLVSSHPQATFYHKLAWKQLVEEVYGLKSKYFICTRGKELEGIAPFFEMRNLSWEKVLISIPFANYGGILAISNKAEQALVSYTNMITHKNGYKYCLMKTFDGLESASGLFITTDYCSPYIRLPDSCDKMFAKLKSKTRNQVRKANKLGLTTICGDSIQLQKDFFKVYSTRMKEHGTPTHGWKWFKKIHEKFKGQYLNIIAYCNTIPIAGVMLFFKRDKAIIHYGASVPGTNHLCPNNITYWQALEKSIDKGMKLFDFGRSRIGSGTYNFKMQWGAENQITPYLYFTNSGQSILQEDPANPAYLKYTRLWKLLPLSITKTLGPFIRKHITT